jgi:hypothetical protein
MAVTFSPSSANIQMSDQPASAVQRIKLNTRETTPNQPQAQSAPPPSQNNTIETPATEEPKPLSPQFAALAREKRALQVKERELAEREKAMTTSPADTVKLADLKSKPLDVLLAHGITYDQIVEGILANPGNPELEALKAELKAVTDRVDQIPRDQEAASKAQVIQEMTSEARKLAATPEFELVKATGSIPQVIELIERSFEKTGEILDVKEAMSLVEDDLFEQNMKIAQSAKIRNAIAPQAPPKPGMRTLTNKDSSSPVLSAKERARRAFYNQT